jgi:hypothetical protein
MDSKELGPGHSFAAFRGGLDAVFLEDVADGIPSNPMAQFK